MKIQSINSTNQNNTSFGLRLSNEAAISIVDQYKRYGAKDSEIAYYLKAIQESAPDTFTLINNETRVKCDCHYDGCNAVIRSGITLQKNNGTCIHENLCDIYDYNDPEVPDFENPYNYNAESKVFFAEHLIKTIKSAVEKLNIGEYDDVSDEIIDENNVGEYKRLIDMSKKWPRIPMD